MNLLVEPAPPPDFEALARVASGVRMPAMLVSAGPAGPLARWSVAAADPVAELIAREPLGPIELRDAGDDAAGRVLLEDARFEVVARVALGLFAAGESSDGSILPSSTPSTRSTSSTLSTPPGALAGADAPFTGGLLGFLSYEFGARFERAPTPHPRDSPAPSAWMGLYPAALVSDRLTGRAWFVRRALRDPRLEAAGRRSLESLRAWVASASAPLSPVLSFAPASPSSSSASSSISSIQSIQSIQSSPPAPADWRDDWTASLPREDYLRAVRRVLDYLRAGDAYQVNLTVRHERPYRGDAGETFARLLRANPAPMASFLSHPGISRLNHADSGAWAIASASPELLLDARADGWIETRPIKGTAPRRALRNLDRGAALDLDHAAARALLSSEKDRAEHVMIVDLERNDLGRVCRPGTVRVDPFLSLESGAVHHLVSGVRGRLRAGLDAIDALAAVFPGGSVTGAPKVRAMEIVRELEPVPRGAYTGAIGALGADGTARFALAIRTLTLGDGRARSNVGGGIVIDSDPDREWEECRLKGERTARALEREG